MLGLVSAPTQPALAATCTVTSTADAGPGTLRQCLRDVATGDTITFDPAVFPPGAPATITLTDPLPAIAAGGVTVDASNAGVRLDGGSIDEGNADGILLASSNNAIYGLHLHHFTGSRRQCAGRGEQQPHRRRAAGPAQHHRPERQRRHLIRWQRQRVAGNWIGTEDGLTLPGAAGNAGDGVELYGRRTVKRHRRRPARPGQCDCRQHRRWCEHP